MAFINPKGISIIGENALYISRSCTQIMSSILLPTFCLRKLDIAFNFFLFSKSASTTKEEIYMLFSFCGNKLNEIKNQVKGFLKVLD